MISYVHDTSELHLKGYQPKLASRVGDEGPIRKTKRLYYVKLAVEAYWITYPIPTSRAWFA